MGHGHSKPETRMELRPGMRPIWRKIEEVKWRRRERKLSIVSTAELLRTEESDEIVDDESTRGDAGMEAWQEDEVSGSPKTIATAFAAAEKVKEETTTDDDEKAAKVKEETTTNDDGKETAVEEKETAVEEKETAAAATVTAVPEKKEEEEEEDDDDGEKGRKFGSFAADDELPGSPSFRFWDLARDTEDDLVKFDGTGTRDKLPQIMEMKKTHERENSTDSVNWNEDLEIKPLKKDKGRRLKALTKAPGHVCNLLIVRNCYNYSCSATRRDREGLLGGKPAL